MNTRDLIQSALVAGLILTIGYFVSLQYAGGAFEGWEALGAPPIADGKMVTIHMDPLSNSFVYLEIPGGQQLQRGSTVLCSSTNCWDSVDAKPKNPDSSKFIVATECQSEYQGLTPYPGRLASCASYSDVAAGSHLVREAHFVLLEDGTYWVWRFVPGMGALYILILVSVAAILGGLTTFFSLRGRRSLSKQRV